MVFFQNRKHGHQAIVLSSRSVSVARQIIAEVAESLFCNFIQETNLTERLSKLQFVARRLAGEPMADLCREFGISRKTGQDFRSLKGVWDTRADGQKPERQARAHLLGCTRRSLIDIKS